MATLKAINAAGFYHPSVPTIKSPIYGEIILKKETSHTSEQTHILRGKNNILKAKQEF